MFSAPGAGSASPAKRTLSAVPVFQHKDAHTRAIIAEIRNAPYGPSVDLLPDWLGKVHYANLVGGLVRGSEACEMTSRAEWQLTRAERQKQIQKR
ncbi:unnamed protein product [Lota lota]